MRVRVPVADVVWGVFFTISNNFIQYFLSDVIGACNPAGSCRNFLLHYGGDKPLKVASNAESAVSIFNLVVNVVTIVFSPVGGWLADRYNRPVLCGLTLVASGESDRSLAPACARFCQRPIRSVCTAAAATFVTAATSSYTVVLWMAALQGSASALGGGAILALTADAASSAGDGSNAARDFTILGTLGGNLPGIVVPSLCVPSLWGFSSRALGYRVFWAIAGGCCLLSAPILVCCVKPAPAARDADRRR